MNILTINLIYMTLVFAIAARIYIVPKLGELKTEAIVIPILLLHATRHFGLMFLSPGATYPGIPSEFAYPAALGDMLAALLATGAIALVVMKSKIAKISVWIFNVIGTVDLLFAIFLATYYEASAFMGAAYWIPAFWVPALLVTHYLTFLILIKYWRQV